MSNTWFIIKKSKFSNRPVPIYWSMILPIWYIVLSLFVFFSMYCDYDMKKNADGFMLLFMIIFLLFALYWFYLLIRIIREKRAKNLKYNWLWIVKKAKVMFVWKLKFNNRRWYKVDVYYIEVENSGVVYYSNGYTKWTLWWTSIKDLQLLYAKYWFPFNEGQNPKEEVLRKIDESISEKEYEAENSWFISKMMKNRNIWNLRKDREKVSEWYIPTFWQVDGNKVSVWDIVDIYFDPDNSKRYWVDIDFLFWKS